mmetsp:Transcript_21743/g.10195  ORF Transcript_21743/g.10195 Transcript_21743/m.10195 type:complete len:282 (-) Transcript_21743:1023-1868(-)
MANFFAGTRPGRVVTHSEVTFELPILYFRDDFFGLYFTADYEKVKAFMPSDKLFPIILPNGRAIVAIFACNYIDTSIGLYGEVPVAIPAVYGKEVSKFSGIVPALLESRYPGYGLLVYHLPVTNVEARDVGRGEWGYTKFVADMHFNIMPEYMESQMYEEDQHIFYLRVQRKGFYVKDRKPITTFSVKNNKLIKTVIPHKVTKRISLNTTGSFLKLGQHPMAQAIRDLGISSRPFMTCYYPERAAILPSGEVIEEGAKAFDGYMGKTRDAKYTVTYAGQGE